MTHPLRGAAQRLWAGFVARHLYDYNTAATRLWLLIVAAGACAGAWALAQMLGWPLPAWGPVLLGMGLVLLASAFPLQIPRSSHSLGLADVFTFSILLTLGPAPAVLAAGAEGALGAWRSSRRLSSRWSTPAAAMAAMACCGLAFEALRRPLAATLGPAPADLLALCAVAALPFVLTSLPLMAVVVLKRGGRVKLSDWIGSFGWIGALVVASGLVAGVVHLVALQHGPAVRVVVVCAVFLVMALLRVSFRHQEAEHAAQESRIAQARGEAELNQQRFSAAFTHAGVGMTLVDQHGRILQVNAALCELLADDESRLLGQPFRAWLHPSDADLFQRRLDAQQGPQDPAFSMELRCRPAGADDRWVALHASHFADPGAAGHCRIFQLHDITSRRLAESRLQHIAYHDSLTDLANRNCFQERLTLAVEASRTDPATRFAVMFLDLDRFKIVNDSLGHMAGNALLREVANRLRACVRPVDLVARLGGDEFAVLLDQLSSTDDASRLAQRVLDSLMQPVHLQGTEIVPGASIGLTLSDLGYRSVDEILRDADLAMYEAKGAGRGRVVVFNVAMHERIADRLALEADLRRAIGAGQLSVAFQPIYKLHHQELMGFEALARWVHPERGPISPAVFIALAEESGHIAALTRWVIDHAAGQLAAWMRHSPAARDLTVHVNISGRDLSRPEFVGEVRQVLAQHGLAPGQLTLEITETTLMAQLQLALAALQPLRELGVRFSIDDFGTGYSSLAYLSTLPFDSLKIDRSFVMGMEAAPQNVEIVRAVVDLARSLGKKVIAEGIETPEQLQILRRLGVPWGQGYLMARPLRADQVPALLLEAEATRA